METTEFDVVQGDRTRLPGPEDNDWVVLRDAADNPVDLTDRSVDFIFKTGYTSDKRVSVEEVEIHDDPTTGKVAVVLSPEETAFASDDLPLKLYAQFRVRGGEYDPTTYPVEENIGITVYDSIYAVESGVPFLSVISRYLDLAVNGMVDAGGTRLTNLADPIGEQDATTRSWVENQIGSRGFVGSGSFSETADGSSDAFTFSLDTDWPVEDVIVQASSEAASTDFYTEYDETAGEVTITYAEPPVTGEELSWTWIAVSESQ